MHLTISLARLPLSGVGGRLARLSALLVASCLVSAAHSADIWTDVVPGVRHLHRTSTSPRPLNIHVLTVDVTSPHVRVGTLIKNESLGPDGGERTSSMAARHGALAAINGDYFSSGTVESHIPQGISIHDGFLIPVSGHVPGRLSWVMEAGTLNSFIGVFATTYPYSAPAWMFNAASGGPRLVRNGIVSIENTAGLPSAGSLNPRTALGVSQDHKTLILATVDGRMQGFSEGMTGHEMGALLIEMGAWDGMNFDSGGSTTFYLNGAVRNVPSDGSERLVANAIAVWDTFDQGPEPVVSLGSGFEHPSYSPGGIDGQDGWLSSAGGSNIQSSVVYSGDQALEINESSARRNVTTSSDKVQWIDLRMRRDGGQGSGTIAFGTPFAGKVFGIVGFQNGGSMSYYDGNTLGGGTYKPLAPYVTGEWYRVSIRIDYNVRKYSVYVDGRQYAVGANFRDADASDALGGILIQEFGSGSLVVDDLYVGNTRFDFPRVEPDQGTMPLNGHLRFVLKNAPAVSSWEVIEERDSGGNAAPSGSIASIDLDGYASAHALGSFAVRATDGPGRQDKSGRIEVMPSIPVGGARQLSPGSSATIATAVVTAVFPGHIYAEREDRSAGIRIDTPQQPDVGQRISAVGTVVEDSGETVLDASALYVGPQGEPPDPVFSGGRRIAESFLDAGTPGADLEGLLVTTFGRITSVESDRFRVDDGGTIGGTVIVYTGLESDNINRFVAVTGPLGSAVEEGQPVPAIKMRSESDVVILD